MVGLMASYDHGCHTRKQIRSEATWKGKMEGADKIYATRLDAFDNITFLGPFLLISPTPLLTVIPSSLVDDELAAPAIAAILGSRWIAAWYPTVIISPSIPPCHRPFGIRRCARFGWLKTVRRTRCPHRSSDWREHRRGGQLSPTPQCTSTGQDKHSSNP